jgi:hypothetical protein
VLTMLKLGRLKPQNMLGAEHKSTHIFVVLWASDNTLIISWEYFLWILFIICIKNKYDVSEASNDTIFR